ncbi:phage holin family protein [Flavobacterium zepuense]|nr:phage holin family protein [Flavobacterium zepuense]
MKILQSFLLSIVTFFSPVQGILIAVGVTIMADTITGVYRCKKLKQPIVSKRLRQVANKMAVYEAAVILFWLMDHYLLSEFFKIWFSVDYFFTKIVALVLIFTEMVSIKENIEEAHSFSIAGMIRTLLKSGKEIKNDVNQII